MTRTLEVFSLIVKRWLPTCVWMGAMLYASTDVASGGHTGSALHHFLDDFGIHLSEQTIGTINLIIRKGAHVTEFAILAILLWRDGEPLFRNLRQPFDLRLTATVMAISMVFAATSEFVQRFFPSRDASIRDVFINTGGAALGLFVLFMIRRHRAKKAAKNIAGTILITSNLHLDSTPAALIQLKAAIARTRPSLCLVLGDLGPADRAAQWLAELKAATGDTRLVICLGNQDHWLPSDRHADFPTLSAIRERLWRPATKAAGIPCLDFGNVEFADLVLVGGYGHFDLGMRSSQMEFAGQPVTLENYHRGEFSGLVSYDMKYLPNASASLAQEAQLQAEGISARLAQAGATGKSILVATHMLPFPGLLGDTGDGTRPTDFLHAYSGNTLVGRALTDFRGKIELVVCGHTNAHVPRQVIAGISCLNIGSDHGALSFVLFDPANPNTPLKTFRAGQG